MPFMIYALLSSRQARRSKGNLGLKLLRDSNYAFWTLTAWQSEEDMRTVHDGGISSEGDAQTVGLVR